MEAVSQSMIRSEFESTTHDGVLDSAALEQLSDVDRVREVIDAATSVDGCSVVKKRRVERKRPDNWRIIGEHYLTFGIVTTERVFSGTSELMPNE